MRDQHTTRRLAAILAADVAGYSRMMEVDEADTISSLNEVWRGTFNPEVEKHYGRIVKTMGDGALVQFGSVVDAMECAVAIQRAMHSRNTSAQRRVDFRIGINVGDVVVAGGDIL